MRAIPVPRESVDEVWPMVAHWVASCKGEDPEELRQKCAAGDRHQLMVVMEAGSEVRGVVILERCGIFLHGTTLAGNIGKGLDDLLNQWHDIALAVGCRAMSIQGRKGWERKFKKYGFEKKPDGRMEVLCRLA